MDNNEFSLDALLKICEFIPYESIKTKEAFNELCIFLEKNIDNHDISEEIQGLVNDFGCSSFDDAFKQGFCFAVKSIKFMMKI